MSKTTRHGRPIGLLGMVVLVCAVEGSVSNGVNTLTSPLILEWGATLRDAERESPGCAVLCFGSSMVKNGVLPAVIEARTGLRGYNLALPGGSPPLAYHLLRKALDGGARPTAVVVDFEHTRLEDWPFPDRSVQAMARVLDFADAIELGRRTGDGVLLGRLLVSIALPTARARHDLRAAVVATLEGRDVSQRVAAAAYDRNRRLNRGAHVQAKVSTFQDFPAPAVTAGRPAPWNCHPVNAHYVERFLQLTGSRGVSVYWLMPPLPPGHQALNDAHRSEERYLDLVRRLVSRHAHVTVVDGRHAGYPASAFIDPVHLDRTGALSLSESLASVLVRRPGDRWVGLDRFRVSPREAGVEDCMQSASAVLGGGDTARR